MSFAEILGQDDAIWMLKQALRQDRLPSAWMFSGPQHVGKFKTALALSQLLNCKQGDENACGHCDTCMQIENRSFSNFMVVAPDSEISPIRIKQIHETLRWMQLRPQKGEHRVLILDHAERMNRESANAFLKTLEEPPPQTLIILLVEYPQQLPETLISRCQRIRFKFLQTETIQTILRQQTPLSEAHIRFLATYSMGQVIAQEAEQVEHLQSVHQTMTQMLAQLSPVRMEETLSVMNEWSRSKSETWRLALDFLETWFRDILWIHHGLPSEHLLHQDHLKELHQCEQRYSRDTLLELYHLILKIRASIELNANKALALEAFWIHLKHARS